MRLHETLYAAVGPDGKILQPFDGTKNGIYLTKGKAQTYLTKQLRQYQSWVSSYRDGLSRDVNYTQQQLKWYEEYEDRLEYLKASEVKEIKIVLVE